jgi:rod shape-determining protein MreC
MRTIFGRGPSLQLRLFITVLLSLAGIVADARFHLFDSVRLYINTFASPMLHLASVPRDVVEGASLQLRSRSELITENQQLQQQLFLLRSDLLRMAELSQENRRLRELLGSPVTQDSRKLVARILSVDSDPFVYQVVIDKGIEHHVYEGQPVVNDQGVIGQVVSVGKTSSRVLLITDVSHALPVRVLRNDLRAIASGTGNINELTLKNLPKNVDIQDGDILVTSGMGGHFPEGYPVAKVVRVANEKQSPFAEIKAEPLATLDRLRYVLLLWEDAKAMGPLAVMSPSSVNSTASAAASTDAEKNKNAVPERHPTTVPAMKPAEKVEKKTGTTTHKAGVNKTTHQNTNKIKSSTTIAATNVKRQEHSQ